MCVCVCVYAVMNEYSYTSTHPLGHTGPATESLHVHIYIYMGTAVAKWLRCCAKNRKFAGPISVGVIGIFH